jgi:hypothetical protein
VQIRGVSRRSDANDDPLPGLNVVLIISHDAVGAALIGALVETLGYVVGFLKPPETADEAMRRVRPSVAMVDCEDPDALSVELIGRARMRAIAVLMFGSRVVTRRMRELAEQYDLRSISLPVTATHLGEELARSLS